MKNQLKRVQECLETILRMLDGDDYSKEVVSGILKDVYGDYLKIKYRINSLDILTKKEIVFLCDLLRLKASCDDDDSYALMHKYLSNFDIKKYCANLIKKLKGLI